MEKKKIKIEKKIKFFSQKNLDATVAPLFFSPQSIFFLPKKNNFFHIFFSTDGRKKLFNSKLSGDQHVAKLYNTLELSTRKDDDKKLLTNWWEKRKDQSKTREHAQDRPQNVRVFRTHRGGVSKPNMFVQGDLMEASWLNPDRTNRRYKYLLVLVDMFSSKKYLIPTKTKKAKEISKVLNDFFRKNVFKKLQTDKGGEFINELVKDALKKHDVKLYTTKTTQKAYMAERAIREIKQFFNELIQNNQLHNFLDNVYSGEYNRDDWTGAIPYLTNFLNKKIHSRLKFTPEELSESTDGLTGKAKARVIIRRLLARLYVANDQTNNFRARYLRYPFKRKGYKTFTKNLPIGTLVRVSKLRLKGTNVEEPFVKPSTAPTTWSDDKYKIVGVRKLYKPEPFRMYQLKNMRTLGFIKNLFYREEITPVPNTRIQQYYKDNTPNKKFLKQEALRQKDDGEFRNDYRQHR